MQSKRLLKNKKTVVFLLFIVIVGFFLRVYHLGRPSLWYDELMTAGRINYSFAQTVKNLAASPFPPLYYILMNLWVRIFGNSEFFLRFPSLIFSVLSIIFIFYLAKGLFDERIGLFSALFLSISPYSIYYAQEAKMYSMLWSLAILSFLFFHRFMTNNKIGSLLLYVVFTTISIYTMYIGFIFILIQNILFICFFKAKWLKKWLLGQLLIILLYLPWVDKFFYTAVNKTGVDWIHRVDSYLTVLATIFYVTLGGVVKHKRFIELGVYCFLIISSVISLSNAKQRKYFLNFTQSDHMLFIWVIVPLVLFGFINILVCPLLAGYTTRYAGFIHIPLIILMSKGINKYKAKFKYTLLIFLLLVTFFYRLYPLYQYSYRALGDDWRTFLNELRQRGDNNSLILTDLPLSVIQYYNKDYETCALEYIEVLKRNAFNKNYDSIFVVYRYKVLNKNNLLPKLIKKYEVRENYSKPPNGFLWLKRKE